MLCLTASTWLEVRSTPISGLDALELPRPAPVRFADPRKPRLPVQAVDMADSYPLFIRAFNPSTDR
jgi:hypothetical protein